MQLSECQMTLSYAQKESDIPASPSSLFYEHFVLFMGKFEKKSYEMDNQIYLPCELFVTFKIIFYALPIFIYKILERQILI